MRGTLGAVLALTLIVSCWGGDAPARSALDEPVTDASGASPAASTPDQTASVTFVRVYTLTTSAGEGGSVDPAAGTHTYNTGTSVTVTATWDDATYVFTGWSDDCSGAEPTCALTIDGDKAATASFAQRCTTTTNPTCIRAIYLGAPGDYVEASDIPADVLLTPDSDGRYYAGRGEQVTVLTAASLPAGYTRFYLQRSPQTSPSPVSREQLVPPVGTTYTFTVATDGATATLITYDLTAAKPHPQRPSHKPALGDVAARTAFQVVSCESGTAVRNPEANEALVQDCKHLLALRGALAGTGTLNWHAGVAMTDWEGVTVDGTPQRVTKLAPESSGLTGELSGLLGDLTALVELHLNGNMLTGAIPSKLETLTTLTHLYLADNTLAGCVPSSLEEVANNDLATLGLPDCSPPIDVSDSGRGRALTAGTYQFTFSARNAPLVFDIPIGAHVELFNLVATEPEEGTGYSTTGLLLRDEATQSRLCLDLIRAIECGRWIRDTQGDAIEELHSVDITFDRISESLWVMD